MTAYPLGKQFTFKLETATPGVFAIIANARSHDLSINNAPIDVTDKDGMPYRKLIAGGVKSLDGSFSGIFTDAATIKQMLALTVSNNPIANFQMIDGLGNLFQGPFHVSGLDRQGAHDKETTYSFKIASADFIAFTPAP